MIEQLITRRQLNAQERLQHLISEARDDCAAFGTDLDWDAKAWDVTAHCPRPANKSHNTSWLYFTTHENGTSKGAGGRVALPEPFCSMLKAFVRLKQDGRAQTMDPLARFISAARDLAVALEDRNYDPCLLRPDDFDAAVTSMKRRLKATTLYREATALAELAQLLDARGITVARLDWKNPIPRQKKHSRTSDQADVDRANKLPTEDVLAGLADIWQVVETPSDVILMGCVTLLHCAPWRIVEVLAIPEDCEVEQQKVDQNGDPVLDRDGLPIVRYGIRYWTEKLDEPDIKWIPSVMQDTARQAIARIREQTEGARVLARWLNAHPGRAYLPGLDQGPDQTFSSHEVADLLGQKRNSSATQWLKQRNVAKEMVPSFSGGPPRTLVRRIDLERALLAEMPVVPHQTREVPTHQRLFISFGNCHHAKRKTNPCVVGLVTDQHVRDFLGGRGVPGEGGVRSAFDRLLDRDDLRARTHQLRHWLITLSVSGGLEQALIGRWAGHDEDQNADYDHVGGIQLAEVGREMLATGKAMGVLAEQHKALPPVERAGFREAVIATAHVTEIGFCLQDWITSPCPEFGACDTCESCAVIKGNEKSRARVMQVRDDTVWTIERIETELEDGTIGASNHLNAARSRLAALDRTISIHDDPEIPDGTLVQPNRTSPDHFGGPILENGA